MIIKSIYEQFPNIDEVVAKPSCDVCYVQQSANTGHFVHVFSSRFKVGFVSFHFVYWVR